MEITPKAGQELVNTLDSAKAGNDYCIRLNLAAPTPSMIVDREQLGDEIIHFGGKKVLAMDAYTAELCSNVKLDCREDQFVLLGEL